MSNFSKAALAHVLFCLFLLPSTLFAANDPYASAGFDSHRNTVSIGDFEHLDPFTGGLILNFEDMNLPGNGALDLSVRRTYNSKNLCNTYTINAQGKMTCLKHGEDSWVGLGWTLHFGRLICATNNCTIEMPDGSRHETFLLPDGTWIAKNYGKLQLSNNTFVATLSDGKKITFGHYAGLNVDMASGYNEYYASKIEDANGNAITISYYEPDNDNVGDRQEYYAAIKSVTDTAGRVTYFNLSTNLIGNRYRLSSITRPDGRSISFNYQTINDTYHTVLMTRVNPPEGDPWIFAYDLAAPTFDLTRVTTSYGGLIDYTYGLSKGPLSSCNTNSYQTLKSKTVSGRDVTAGTWLFQYFQGLKNEETVVTDHCGRTLKYRHFSYDSVCGLNGSMWKIGLLISKETVGEETVAYEWIPSTAISYDDYTMGVTGRDTEIYVPYLSKQTITRGGQTYTTTYGSFDSYGNPRSITETGDKTRSKSLTYWYNTAKNIVHGKPLTETITGTLPGSFSSSFIYDTNGNPTQENRYGIITNRTYLTNGNLSSVTDPRGYTTSYLWSNGRISRTTNPLYNVSRTINPIGTIASETNGRGYTTSYTYDGNLRLTSIVPPAGNTTSISYPADNSYKQETRGGYWLRTYYDGLGRPSGTGDSKNVTTDIVYKACGLKDYTTSNIGETTYYDSFGRTTKVLHKDSSQILYAYSGNDVTVTDEAGRPTYLYYDTFGNPDEKMLMSVRDAANNTATYTRNMLGSLTGITQGSISRSYTYNAKNFLTGESNPETGSINYGRDNNGNMTSRTDAAGTVNYTYDQINRLTNLSFGGESITYGYDNADNRTSMTSPGATASYVYDAANRMTSQGKTISGRAFTTGYGYDGNDNLTSLTYPKGLALTYGYNTNNQMTSVSGFGGSVTGIGYNTAGLPTGFSYSNGKTTSISYNSRNMTTQINAGTVYNIGFGYDSRGNTTSITDNLPTTPVLTHKIDPSKGSLQTTMYGYSSNRMTLLSGSETATYGYNNRGDMTSITENGATFTPEYDLLHNLRAYKQGSTTIASYGYDGDGLRVTKTVGGITTVYHHDKSGKLLSETDANGNRIVDYVYVNGNMAAKVDNAGTVSYYHVDPAGTPTAITDSAGALVWRAEYLPFGEEQLLVNSKTNDKMFVGKEKDEETGLYYFGARYMQDRNARFVSVDPVGPVDEKSGKVNEKMLVNPQKINRYAYALNNPYRYIDPDGAWAEDVHSGIGRTDYGTYKWAKDVGFGDGEARAIARANNAVDMGPGTSFMPFATGGDQSRHFNSQDSFAKDKVDSRMFWANYHLRKAIEYAKEGDMRAALGQLGKGLHSLQDIYAHRDWDSGVWGANKHPDWYDNWSDSRNATAAKKTRDESIKYLDKFRKATE